jgi:hypothetical protein
MATTHPIVMGKFSSSGSVNYSFTIPLGGNYFDTQVAVFNCTATITAVVDTAGNTYSNVASKGNETIWIATGSAPVLINNTQLIVTVGSSSNFLNCILLNLPGPNVVDKIATASGSSTTATVSTGTINDTDDTQELVIAFAAVPSGTSVNWSGGCNPLATNSTASAAELSLGFGNLLNGATSMTPLGTLGTSGAWSLIVCTFATRISGAMGIVPTIPNAVSASVQSPALDTTIVTLNVSPGTYQIPWSVSLSGTITGTEASNMQLVLEPSFEFIASASYPAVPGVHPQPTATVLVPPGQRICIQSLNPGTSGSIYGGTIIGPWPTVPTINGLNQLSYATSFLVNCAVRPSWHMFKKLLVNGAQNAWTVPAYGNVAYDSDRVATPTGAVINTQGYYLTESCLQVNNQVVTTPINWSSAFKITAGPNNPYQSPGSTRWYGYRSSGMSTVSGQCDAFTCSDVTPFCLYPGDLVTPIFWNNATGGVTVEPAANNPLFMSGVFSHKFTGYWLSAGTTKATTASGSTGGGGGTPQVMPTGVPASQVGTIIVNNTGDDLVTWATQNEGGGTGTKSSSNGVLSLGTNGSNGNGFSIISPNTYTSGIFEAQCVFPANGAGTIANWPAFWLSSAWASAAPGFVPFPDGGEMDLVEGLSGSLSVTYHYGVSGTEHNIGSFNITTTPGTHIITGVWTTGEWDTYYDGVLVKQMGGPGQAGAGDIVNAPMNVIFSGYEGTFGYQPGQAANFLVNYFRVWNIA